MGLANNFKTCNFNDLADDAGEGADCDSRDGEDGFGSVSCSICLETVVDSGDRSWAKLQCGHQFHLDCIGSAFNAKGSMQCPNCRKVEKGQWLYANGNRPLPEITVEDWTHEEDIYDLGYSEMSFGVQWCPFGSLARLPSFEDGEFSPSSYPDLLGQHGFFTEHAASSAAGHPCPYVAYFGPIHPSSSNSAAAASVSDSSSFSNPWSTAGSSVGGEVHIPYGFAIEPHYHAWDYHSSPPPPPPPPFSASGGHIGSPPQPTLPPMAPRTSRGSSDGIRLRPPHYMRPLLSHRVGSSVPSVPRVPSYPGSRARARDRVQALQAYYQQSPHPSDSSAMPLAPIFPTGRRPSRVLSPAMGSTASSSDQTGGGGASGRGFVRFNIWERDHFPHNQPQPQPQQPMQMNQVDDTSPWTNSFAEGSGSFHHRHGGGL